MHFAIQYISQQHDCQFQEFRATLSSCRLEHGKRNTTQHTSEIFVIDNAQTKHARHMAFEHSCSEVIVIAKRTASSWNTEEKPPH